MWKTKNIFFLLFLLFFCSSCSVFNSDSQFTNKIVAQAFVSELYGSTTKTIEVTHQENSHIDWLGFIQSNNYKYFKIIKVEVGDQTIVSDGEEIDGKMYVATSNAIIEDISVSPSNSKSDNDLKITIQYSPLLAIESENEPHEAFLIVHYDSPDQGAVRIQLEGYTDGINDSKCTRSADAMTVVEYELKNSEMSLYFCGQQVTYFNQDNVSDRPDTNLAFVPFDDDVITFYQVDEETVCLLTSPSPSIPDFTLPIPEGLAPIDSMPITMTDGSFAECTLDEDSNIYCDANILISALVSTTGFTMTNQAFTAEDLVTTDCPDFGSISGSGVFGDSDLTVLFKGKTLSDQNSEAYQIVDSLILGVLDMKKVE